MTNELLTNLAKRVTVGDILRRTAERYPEKEGLVYGEQRLTFSQMNKLANQVGNAFLDWGLKPGDRVSSLSANSGDFMLLSFGLAKAGVVLNPVNPVLSPEDIIYIINHVESRVLVVDDVLVPKAKSILPKLPAVEKVIVLKATGQGEAEEWPELHQFLASASDWEVEAEVSERDLVQILYTSGTTAAPKGAMISHLSVYLASLAAVIDGGFRTDDNVTAIMPLFHCAQLALAFGAVHRGAKLVVIRQFDPKSYLQLLEKEKITWMFALPMMYRALLDCPQLDSTDTSSLRFCLYAMTPMDRRTLEEGIRRLKADFALGSGQTEAYPPTVFFRPEDQLRKEGSYWGTPVPTVDIGIMDDDGNLVPWGTAGEIVYRGGQVMEGYLKDPAATAKAFAHGWFHSGDVGMIDEEGLLLFIDRKKDMVKTGGENVASVKVESVILSDPRVESAAIIGLPHPHWGEALTAVVVARKDSGLTEDEVIKLCRSRLAGFEVPKAVIFRESLPMTSTGKLQKYQLRQELAGHFTGAGS